MSDSYQRTGNFTALHYGLALILVVAYLATRLSHLTLLPIFTDEAVYIVWSQSMARDFSEFLLPVRVENNRPLFFWLIAASLRLIDDPLLAGRIVSVAAGLFSLAGICLITSRLHSSWAGLLAGVVSVISPYHLFFDRIAHKAALLDCFFVWLIWVTLALSQPQKIIRPWEYLLFVLLLSLSLLTEATALLFVFLPLPFLLFFSNTPRLVPVTLCYLSALAVGIAPNAYLYFTDDKYQLKNIFIPSYNSMAHTSMTDMALALPQKILQNAAGVSEHFIVYLTWPLILLATFYFTVSLSRMNRKAWILTINFFLPVLALAGTAGAGFSRYYLFCATPLVIWGSLSLAEILSFLKRVFSRVPAYLALATGISLIFMQASSLDYQLWYAPEKASLSGTDQYQYISSEFSGYGCSEAVGYLKKLSQEKKIAVFTSSNWGVPDDCVTLYLSGSTNIDIFMGYWVFNKPLLPPDMESFEIYDKFTSKRMGAFQVKNLPQDIYFITRTPSISRDFFLGMNSNFQLIESFRKPIGTLTIDIYKQTRP